MAARFTCDVLGHYFVPLNLSRDGTGIKSAANYRRATLVFIGAAWWIAPVFESAPEQDKCEFGTGSTVLYDQLSMEARSYLAKNGKSHVVGLTQHGDFSPQLTRQLNEFAASRATINEQVAAAHALLRAYNMEFYRQWPKAGEPRGHSLLRLELTYYVPMPRLDYSCVLCWIFNTANVTVRLMSNGGKDDPFEASLFAIRPYVNWTEPQHDSRKQMGPCPYWPG
jgi:hypothetical protein